MILLFVDWSIYLLIAIIDNFYLIKLYYLVHRTPFTSALKCLLLSDGICLTCKLVHDVSSYYLGAPLGEFVGQWIRHIMIFVECFPFFFAMFMIPVFGFLFMTSIWKPVYFNQRVGRRHFQMMVVLLIIIADLVMTVYLMVDKESEYSYSKEDHNWNYKEAEKWSTYKIVNVSLQGVCFFIYASSMIIFFILLRRHVIQSRVYAFSITSTSVTMKIQLQQACRYFLVCLFFYCGTAHFNLMGECQSLTCQISGIFLQSLNRAKWIIFCALSTRPKVHQVITLPHPASGNDEPTPWK